MVLIFNVIVFNFKIEFKGKGNNCIFKFNDVGS